MCVQVDVLAAVGGLLSEPKLHEFIRPLPISSAVTADLAYSGTLEPLDEVPSPHEIRSPTLADGNTPIDALVPQPPPAGAASLAAMAPPQSAPKPRPGEEVGVDLHDSNCP